MTPVDAAEAVHLEVDKTRGRDPAPPVAAANAVAGDAPVAHLDVARDELPVDECRFDAQSHCTSATCIVFGIVLPWPCASSRRGS